MHKAYSLLALFILLSSGIFFQSSAEIIVFTNGNKQAAIVKEITSTEIKYTKKSRPNGPLYTILKSEIDYIDFEDGTIEAFHSFASEKPSEQMQIPQEANALAIQEYKTDITYTGKETDKEARVCYGLCKFDDESVLFDGNIKIDYLQGYCCPINNNKPTWMTNNPEKPIIFWEAIKIKLTNNSSKTIFIDLANTFFKRGSFASPYYTPYSTTNHQSDTNGIGLNIGGITNALGIGGFIGNLASGINIGAASTSGTSATIYSQRIISIPPNSYVVLDPQLLFPPDLPSGAYKIPLKHYGYSFSTWQLVGLDKNWMTVNIGQTINYEKDSSPISFGLFLTYSFDENFSKSNSMNNTAYLYRVVGLENYKPATHARFHTKKAANLSEGFLDTLHLFFFTH